MGLFVAVDTGGTFTDLAVYDSDAGGIAYTKSLTTHDRPLDGIMACIGKTGVYLARADQFKHGTTLVINALLERDGPRIALVTTEGFRDTLEFGRGGRMEVFNLFYGRGAPLVPRELRFEVRERIDAAGTVLAAPTRDEVLRVAARIVEADVEAVAVSLINAYVDPLHEGLIGAWLREALPGHYVTLGSDLTREWYEYERTATAVANAYTGPKVGRHVAALGEALDAGGFDGRLLLMGSSGGMLSPRAAADAPVLLVESGPVGGCIGAGALGRMLGFDNIIAFDMGGTTAKCALVRDGEFDVQSIYHAGGLGRGTPIRAPVLDIVEVGAGGGSIGWLDELGRLRVGPRSAGSTPGPAAYGHGGTEPTVTDANLSLGRLNPANFQGGEMALDMAAAHAALERVATPLGYTGVDGRERLACGILEIASVTMGDAIRRITVQRGQDPSGYVMFAYGGGGPLHGVELAREVAIPTVVIPPEPGNFCALGMLLADIRDESSRTFLRPLDETGFAAAREALAELEQAVRASVARDFGELETAIEHHAELRYVGQHHTVRARIESPDAAGLRARFVAHYRDRFGHASDAAAEIVSLTVIARAATPKPDLALLAEAMPQAPPPPSATRQVYFVTHGRAIDTPVFSRVTLPRGFAAGGPAVIEEYGSTTVIGPTDRFVVGPLGEIRIAVGEDPRRAA